jgi:hypothetical protein
MHAANSPSTAPTASVGKLPGLLRRISLPNRTKSCAPSLTDVRLSPNSGAKADVARGPLRAMKRREQVQRNCQCASTSRQKTHQAKADRAPRFRQCLIIARRSSTCRVELHWHLGPGADHGRMARIAEAWDRSTAPGATSRSTISSASVRLQRLRLACRSGAQLIPILVMAGPVLAMHVFGQIYSIHFERGPPCQKKRSRRRNRKPN